MFLRLLVLGERTKRAAASFALSVICMRQKDFSYQGRFFTLSILFYDCRVCN